MYRGLFEDSASRTTRWYEDFNDYSGYVFLLEFLTLAYLAGAKEVHEILGRRTCKRLSSSRQRTYFSPFISHTLATQAVLNSEL